MGEEGRAQEKEEEAAGDAGKQLLHVMQWGYLPASSPHHLPLLLPTLAYPPPPPPPPPSSSSSASPGQEGWKAVCVGGCGFALAISESGKLHTWGSTCDLGQSYVTAGKHEERPEPFPLPSENPISQAAAGWAHCVVVTDKYEVLTWGWRECVPSVSKVGSDEYPRNSANVDKADKVVDSDGRSLTTLTSLNPADTVDPHELPSPASVGTEPKSKMGRIVRDKVSSLSVERKLQEESFSLPKRQSIKSPESSSKELVPGIEKFGEEGTKRRRVLVENVSASSDISTFASPCLVTLYPGVRIVSVAAGGRHTLVLSDAGQVWAWGYGGEGQLGLGSRIRIMSSPSPVQCFGSSSLCWQGTQTNTSKGSEQISKVPGRHAKVIACGGRHSAVLTDAGALLTFGWGLYGQCGQGSTDDELSPSYVSSLGGVYVKSVAAGLWHTVCTSESGDVYSFGGNQFGQLGTGGDRAETLPRLLDAPIFDNVHAVSVSCGARHTAICTDEGRIFCWGWNKYGQLGLGDTLDRSSPVEVSLRGNNAKQVACGWWHTLALVQSRQ